MEVKNEQVMNMDSYTTVKNLCPWDVYFALTNGGDKTIKTNGTIDLLNRDIVSLCNNNNIFFVGEDGQGSHARVFINNPAVRVYVGFDSEDKKRTQQILDDTKLEYIFNLKTQKVFEEHIKKEAIAYHEKEIVMAYARKIKLNDYERISFLEDYTQRKFKI